VAAKDSSQIKQQLALAMQRNDEASFADFCWAGNELLQQQILISLPEKKEHLFYVWGVPGSGKSHLLQATCQAMAQTGQLVAYLPLKLLHNWDPAILEGMSEHALVAVDDIDTIAGNKSWEEALFHLYNRLQAQHNTLIVTGQIPPVFTTLRLADLRSRLTCALILQIHELSDEKKINTLQEYAKKRGLELPKSVGHYILSRCARNMHDLQAVLDRLDHASLVAQRKLTIPFVKDILAV
jgi:DnaA-homolog protein